MDKHLRDNTKGNCLLYYFRQYAFLCNIEMGDHLSPYSKEGFTNPTMDNIFNDMLQISVIKDKSSSKGSRKSTIASDGSCVPASSNATSSNTITPGSLEKIAFLKSILTEQKKTADSLMNSAKHLQPVSQKIVAMDSAYTASFESDIQAPLPNRSGTLQGFTIMFFFLSYIALAIVMSVLVNQKTGNTSNSLKVFAVFVVGFFVLIALLTRFG